MERMTSHILWEKNVPNHQPADYSSITQFMVAPSDHLQASCDGTGLDAGKSLSNFWKNHHP